MIQVVLLPDGRPELPAAARDHGILAAALDGNGPPQDSPAGGWRGIRRDVVGRERLVLRLDGTLADYQQQALDGITQAVTSSVSGLKAHPDGWVEVDR